MPIQDHSNKATEPETPQRQPDSMQGIRVLILDDEEHIRRFLTAALRRSGCIVESAENGRVGLQILLKQDFDVLLVDIRMEEMDGLAFIQEAKKIWPWLGIIIITGYADEEIYSNAKRFGVDTILEKPLQIPRLKQEILSHYQNIEKRVDPLNQQPVSDVQYHLGLLRQLGEMAVEGESLIQALRNLSKGLGRLLPCSAVGLFDMEEDEAVCILHVQEEISTQSLKDIQTEMEVRYEALSGQHVNRHHLRREVDPVDLCTPEGPDATATIATVPILSDGHVHGILTLASRKENAYSNADISFLYHAASHFSTLLVALTRMKHMAARDSLTGLYNRRQLVEEMDYAWGFAERHSHAISIVIIDIDHYKEINDTYGHLVGDVILKDFAELFKDVARASDILGRYGGDEFVAVLQQSTLQDSFTFCTRLLHATREHVFCPGEHDIKITLSIGLANNYNERAPETMEAFFNQADQALYYSKHAGRDRISIWNPDLEDSETDPAASTNATAKTNRSTDASEVDQQTKILVVDDDPSIGRFIQRMLARLPYDVEVCYSAKEAIERVESRKKEYDLLLIDLNLSEESGLDVLERMSLLDSSIVNIMISGEATVANAVASLRFGAYDFVEKPLSRETVLAVIERALEYRRLTQENRRYQLYLEDMVQAKNKSLLETMEQLQNSYQFTLEAMVKMLDAREKTTGQHSQRVQKLAGIIADHLNLSQKEKEDIARGALLHDIGKIAIPDSILLKPGPLNDEEWAIMKTHAEVGYAVIQNNPDFTEVAEIVYSHHERFDGSGYPRGLKGHDICLGARIFAIVDAYDAMRSERVYRKPMTPEKVREEIIRCRGTHFDPELLDIFLEKQDQFEDVGNWATAEAQKPAYDAPSS